MSDLIDIKHIHKQFKDDLEKQQFIDKQAQNILELNKKLQMANDEIAHLKHTLTQPQNGIEKIIVSPEEALIDDQLGIIQQRSYLKELSLEDVKKLDILLKHKKSFKDSNKDIKADSKKLFLSNDELLQLVQKP